VILELLNYVLNISEGGIIIIRLRDYAFKMDGNLSIHFGDLFFCKLVGSRYDVLSEVF
jgi:hypothetical protein